VVFSGKSSPKTDPYEEGTDVRHETGVNEQRLYMRQYPGREDACESGKQAGKSCTKMVRFILHLYSKQEN
jgi:hypothetical protein